MLGVDTMSLGAINNVAVGALALRGVTTGSDNVVAGKNAGISITTGDNNVVIGHSADVSATVNNSVVVGNGANATADDSVVVGFNASSTAVGGIAIGHNATVATADSCQLGDPLAIAAGAVMRFRSQIVSDEAWIGGGVSEVMIDNDGNIDRGFANGIIGTSNGTTPLVLATYSIPPGQSRRMEILVMGRRTD